MNCCLNKHEIQGILTISKATMNLIPKFIVIINYLCDYKTLNSFLL